MDVYTLVLEYPSCVGAEAGRPEFHPKDAATTTTATATERGVHTWEEYAEADFQALVRDEPEGEEERGAREDEEFARVHQQCLTISAEAGCLVSAIKAASSSADTPSNVKPRKTDRGSARGGQGVWQFQASGGYEGVMRARRMVMEGFKGEVRTTVRVPAIHILKSIHASSKQTPLHPSSSGEETLGGGVKSDVDARLRGIGERTGARVWVRMGPGNVSAASPGNASATGETKEPPTTHSTPTGQPTPQAHPINPPPSVLDSARSKSMYPSFLPAHTTAPALAPAAEPILRTDSPEPLALVESPETNISPLPTGDPWAGGGGGPRSKTFDDAATRPRVAGIKSPVPAAAAGGGDTGAENTIEALLGWGFARPPVCEIVLDGREESVRSARMLVLVLLDELNGLAHDVCEIDARLHYALAGRKRQTLNMIQEETNTNIYLPPTTTTVFLRDGETASSSPPALGIEGSTMLAPASTRPGVEGLQDSIARLCVSPAPVEEPPAYVAALRESRDRIHITGDAQGVLHAKTLLAQLAYSRKQSVFVKEAAVVQSKLDWIVSEKQREVSRIMSDNGAHVEFAVGLVKVYGDHRLSVERTMKHVMMLFAELTMATVYTMSPSDPARFDESLEKVLKDAAATKAEVAYRAGQFQVTGTMTEVRQCLPLILTSDAVKNTSHEIRFQCELDVASKSFIAGKRDGKLSRILRATSCPVKFDHLNECNFLIDVQGPGLKVLEALEMLQDELPAEISFHIPESYHRRIIGKGGASVQDVMRRHSAFVKFSSTEQWATFGGHHHNEDNVICITPSKNKHALPALKDDLMLSILTKDRDYDDWIINIDRKYHRALQAETRAYLHHIELVHGANIRFLPREDGQDAIEVFASRYQAKVIHDLLTKVLPVELTCAFNINIELAKVAASAEWLEFTTNILQDLQISILPYSQLMAGGESIFVLKCQRQNLARLKEARARLDMFLRAQPKYSEPFEWTYGIMQNRSETVGPHGGHRRGLSTVVYGSQELAQHDMPKSAGLRRADTVGGQYVDGWRARKQMHKRSETEDGRIDLYNQSGNYPPPIARPVESPRPQYVPEPPRHKGPGGRTQSLDIRNMQDFTGGHSRHASFVSVEQAYNQAGAETAPPTSTQSGATSTFPRYKPGAYPRRGVSVYDPVQE